MQRVLAEELEAVQLREEERQREWAWERDREREEKREERRENERERERERGERERVREREREWEREQQGERERERERQERERERERENTKERERERQQERDWQRHAQPQYGAQPQAQTQFSIHGNREQTRWREWEDERQLEHERERARDREELQRERERERANWELEREGERQQWKQMRLHLMELAQQWQQQPQQQWSQQAQPGMQPTHLRWQQQDSQPMQGKQQSWEPQQQPWQPPQWHSQEQGKLDRALALQRLRRYKQHYKQEQEQRIEQEREQARWEWHERECERGRGRESLQREDEWQHGRAEQQWQPQQQQEQQQPWQWQRQAQAQTQAQAQKQAQPEQESDPQPWSWLPQELDLHTCSHAQHPIAVEQPDRALRFEHFDIEAGLESPRWRVHTLPDTLAQDDAALVATNLLYMCLASAAVTVALDIEDANGVVKVLSPGMRVQALEEGTCCKTGAKRLRIADGWVSVQSRSGHVLLEPAEVQSDSTIQAVGTLEPADIRTSRVTQPEPEQLEFGANDLFRSKSPGLQQLEAMLGFSLSTEHLRQKAQAVAIPEYSEEEHSEEDPRMGPASSQVYVTLASAAVSPRLDITDRDDVVRIVSAGTRVRVSGAGRCASTGLERVRVWDGWISVQSRSGHTLLDPQAGNSAQLQSQRLQARLDRSSSRNGPVEQKAQPSQSAIAQRQEAPPPPSPTARLASRALTLCV